MPNIEAGFHDKRGYLEKMSLSLREKLKVVDYVGKPDGRFLDVGCADGTVTKALAQVFPQARITGIDIQEDFLNEANEGKGAVQPEFEKAYLWEMHERGNSFDTVFFTSVLHEIYSYGDGMTSVKNALTNAYQMLTPGGRILIRDMILSESYRKTPTPAAMLEKVQAAEHLAPFRKDFEDAFGPLASLGNLNHFLLKYFYTENWERECVENYVPVSLEEYRGMLTGLGGAVSHEETYLIPYLREKWRTDFDFSEEELALLRSTTILVAEHSESGPAPESTGESHG